MHNRTLNFFYLMSYVSIVLFFFGKYNESIGIIIAMVVIGVLEMIFNKKGV